MSYVAWQKSSFSSGDPNTNCIEVASESNALRIRESDEPAHTLAPTGAALTGLLRHLKAGDVRPR